MHLRIPLFRIPLFRIWYSTTYTVLFFILIVFLAVTPAETVYQSIRTNELQKLFVTGGVYLFTFFIVLLVYSTRLYTNRSVLQAIPKPYIPVEDGEVGKLVRRMVVKALKRSAIVAWDSRPRDVREEAHCDNHADARSEHGFRRHRHGCESTVVAVSAQSPPWGIVAHPGWASPASPDLSNLQYWKVVVELPNLIEAKAVSLAPPDPAVDGQLHAQAMPMLPDAQIVALLQRPRAMGMRDYLGHLASYGLINPPSLGPEFLAHFEYARFSTLSLTETEFRHLMAIFAELLNGMTGLDPAFIEEARAGSDESDTTSFAASEISSNSTTSVLPYRTPRMHPRAEYFDIDDISAQREDIGSPETLRTAPSMPQNLDSSVYTVPKTPSERSLGSGSIRIRPPQTNPSTVPHNSSSPSLHSTQSVVRLRHSPSEGELPYQYNFDGG